MPAGGLHVEEITVVFGGLVALDAVSMDVGVDSGGAPTDRQSDAPAGGEVVGIIGPNGAGKTTLFNVICGFVRPSSGHLRLGGRELRRHHPHDLPKLGIARTLQGVGLWAGMTAVENVMAGATVRSRAGLVSGVLALPRSTRDEARLRQRAMATLEQVQAAEWADRYPAALPYPIQKRVALARALVSEPSLLLLDEPASGLSSAEMDALGALIRSLRNRMDVLLVEHHMDLVMSVCDRIVVLDFGRVLATGTPEEIQADPAVTDAYLGDAVEVDATVRFDGSGHA